MDTLEKKITIRVTEDEKQYLQNIAAQNRMVVSEYIRRAALGKKIEAKTVLPPDFVYNLCTLMNYLEKLKFENPSINVNEIERVAHQLWHF